MARRYFPQRHHYPTSKMVRSDRKGYTLYEYRTNPYRGYSGDIMLAPSVRAEMHAVTGEAAPTTHTSPLLTESIVAHASSTPPTEDPNNPNNRAKEVSKRGYALAGLGILGGIASIASRGAISPAAFGLSAGASVLAAGGGVALAIKDKKDAEADRRSLRDILTKPPMVAFPPSIRDAERISMWSSLTPTSDPYTNGKGYECQPGRNPYIVGKHEIQMQIPGVMTKEYAGWRGPNRHKAFGPTTYWYPEIYGMSIADIDMISSGGGPGVPWKTLSRGGGPMAPQAGWKKCAKVFCEITQHVGGIVVNEVQVTFIGEDLRRLCTVRLNTDGSLNPDTPHEGWLDSRPWGERLFGHAGPRSGIWPGDDGTIPQIIVFDGVTNPYLKGDTGALGDPVPTALSDEYARVDKAETIPMATVQTIYKMLRLHQPETYAMAAHPVEWACALDRSGDVTVVDAVNLGWANALGHVFKVTQVALSVASIAYPPLAAVAPIAGAAMAFIGAGISGDIAEAGNVLSSLASNQVTAAWSRMREIMTGYRGDFTNFVDRWEGTFETWREYVMGGLPPDWPATHRTIQENIAGMAQTEFTASMVNLDSMWFATIDPVVGMMAPATPFLLHKIVDLMPPPLPEELRVYMP